MTKALLKLDDIKNFEAAKDCPITDVNEALRSAVRQLHEADEIEEFIRTILNDRASTPHGPAEIVDILTHRVDLPDSEGLGAFILKGRSFHTVRPKDVAHQIYRLEKIEGLAFAAFAATGTVLDAAKEQFVSTCKRLKISYSIFDTDDLARLFWAYGFLCPRDGSRIVGGRCHCGYAPSHSILNILQTEALADLRRAHLLNQERALIVLPPGSGKTRIAAKDANACGAESVLYVAHTHEILDVARSEFSSEFGETNVQNLDSAQSPEQGIILTTIQYLEKNRKFVENIQFDYIVVDEFHHAAAKTYRQTLDNLNFGFLLGITATPFRGDRQDILALCNQNIVTNYELRSGVEFGILAPYHYFGCFDDVNYSDLPLVNGKYTIKDLERKLIIKERQEAIVDKWKEKADGRPTLAFCCSHKHAQRVAHEFNLRGIPAGVYLSETSRSERQKSIGELRRGLLKILCVVDVLNEGADIPFVECLMFLRPTESKRIFLQQLGRGLRKYVGKTHCIVIDFIGNFRNAFMILDYQGLRSDDIGASAPRTRRALSIREILDIPIGCKVVFEERVLDLFAQQTLSPRTATRDNIAQLLVYQYTRIGRRLGHLPSRKEMRQNALLGDDLYSQVFGSWKRFEQLMEAGPSKTQDQLCCNPLALSRWLPLSIARAPVPPFAFSPPHLLL